MSLVACGVFAMAQDINPYPRQLLRTESLQQWAFQSGAAGWTALHHCTLAASDGVLKIQSSGNDPYVASGAIHIEGPLTVKLRAKCATGGSGEFFWATVATPGFNPDNNQNFKLIHDGQWHDYTVRLNARGTVTRLRLDPGGAPGLVEIEK
ncbi:MAG: hypothetical protein HGB05_17205, partial [Chloroflexi bacterium]|nr:hypothetical protein [Chloroflexota bacterium]